MAIESLELVDAALRDASRLFPPRPRVVGLHRELGQDSLGRDAVFVWALLANETPQEELAPERVQPVITAIHDAIWQKLGEAGLELRPYVNFRRQAEHEKLVRTA